MTEFLAAIASPVFERILELSILLFLAILARQILSLSRIQDGVKKKVHELHQWHDHRDTEGRLIWWGSPQMTSLLKHIVKNGEKTNELLQDMYRAQTAMNTRIENLEKSRSRLNG